MSADRRLKCSVCVWLGPRLSVQSEEVSAYGRCSRFMCGWDLDSVSIPVEISTYKKCPLVKV